MIGECFQLLFLKYTKDNKRVFYPNIFANGYFITSEEQMIKYRKYGQRFLLVTCCVFYLLLELKIFALMLENRVMDLSGFLGLILVLFVLNLIYNIVAEKIIFKNSFRIEEKFWVNNEPNVKFILSLIVKILLILVGWIIAVGVMVNLKLAALAIALIVIAIILTVIFINKILSSVKDYTIMLEFKALESFAVGEIASLDSEPYSPSSNQCVILETMEVYTSGLICHLLDLECENARTYESRIMLIKSFLGELKTYMISLYDKGVDEKMHDELIDSELLPAWTSSQGLN